LSLDLHRQAEDIMGSADMALARGDLDSARSQYAEAAQLELQALDRIPQDRVRTRGAVAIGAVSLYRKAGLPDAAIQTAYRILGQGVQADWIRDGIEAQLDEIKSERHARELGLELTPHVFEWSLKGPAILEGEGPIGVVLQKMDQVMKFGTRIGEYLAGLPLRRTGPPPRLVRDLMGMTLSEPMPGSFRFRVRLLRNIVQTEIPLDDQRRAPSPEDIASTYINVVRAASEPETDRLREFVDEPEYQEAFLQLVRSVAPDGKQILWVEVSGGGAVLQPTTRLSHHTAESIRDYLFALRPVTGVEEFEDVLRALDLNHGWIVIGEKPATKCYVDKESPVLEDVVGPLVNRRVRVRTYRKGQRLVIRDIEPVEGGDGDAYG